ncbi:MAG: serine/threonine protein kinase [Planctomycetales bacterium]
MSNAPIESSDSKSRGRVDGTVVVLANTADQADETLVRPRDELSSLVAGGKSDAVTVQADTDQESVSQSEEPSSAPRGVAFRSARGIVPLTAIERLRSIATQLQEIAAARILPIQSVGELHDGCVVTMSPVFGVTLEQLLYTRRPSWLESLRIISQITDALVPVHKGGLAHGCLQTSRIFLRNQQLTKIADFALCLVSDELSPTADLNSLACVAPENVDALRFPLTPQMDVYGVGVLLYRLVCGRYPFRADERNEILRQIREDAPQPPRQLAPEIPRELEQLCLQCLAKTPSDRPTAARELSKAFNRLLTQCEQNEQRDESRLTDSDSLTTSQRMRISGPTSVRRVMLIQPEPPDGLVLDTLATTLEQIGIQPEPWSGDGLLFSLPTSIPNSDWTVAFCDRVVRCLRAVAKEQKSPADVAESPAGSAGLVGIRAISARLQSRRDGDQPVNPESIDRQVTELESTIENGKIKVCARGCELLTRSLPCDESKPSFSSPDTGHFRFADRDGGTLKVRGSLVRNQLPLSGRNSQC